MKGKLLVIEGTDGSGKQTQSDLLYTNLLKLGYKVKKISFPNYESNASYPVRMYLSGEFGPNDEVNVYASSAFFAVDRYASFKKDWEKLYNDGYIIISDRYTISNMIHQANRIKNEAEFIKYKDWLIDLEWEKFKIPSPDLMILLDMPYEFSNKLMKNRNNKFTGKEQKDILESDEMQKMKAYALSKKIANMFDFKIISCVNEDMLRSIEDIQKDILNYTKEVLK